jgi:hypothetical protein
VVTPEAFAQTLDAAGASVRLVVLNACYTAPIAEALLAHVELPDLTRANVRLWRRGALEHITSPAAVAAAPLRELALALLGRRR